MNWLPTFVSPLAAGIAAAIAIPSLLLLYFLKLRRKQESISSTLLWKKAAQDLQVNAPFQKLRRNLLLLLQMLVLLALLLALARPVSFARSPPALRTVILIDRSASMAAKDGGDGRTRLEEAKRRAIELVDSMRPNTEAAVIAFDSTAEVVQKRTADLAALRDAIRSVQQTDRPTKLALAYQLAETAIDVPGEALQQAVAVPDVYLYSDGRADDASDLSLQANVTYDPIGAATSRNIGITALSARRNYERPNEVQIFARVANFGPEPVSDIPLQLSIALIDPDQPGEENYRTQQVKQTPTLAPARWTRQQRQAAGILRSESDLEFLVELSTGAVIRLEQMQRDADQLSADDTAFVVVPPPKNLSVVLVTADENSPLRNSILTLGLEKPRVIGPQQYESQLPDDADVLIFDRHAPTKLPPAGNFLYFGVVPPGLPLKQATNPQGLPIFEQTQGVLDWRRDHPIVRPLNLGYLGADQAMRLEVPPDAIVLVDGQRSPLVVLYKNGRSTHLVVAFDLMQSNWPFRETFQYFMYNALQYLALGTEMDVRDSSRPGDMPRLPRPNLERAATPGTPLQAITLRGPPGDRSLAIPASGDFALPPLDRVGMYRTDPPVPQFERIAVNLSDANESNVEPATAPPGNVGVAIAEPTAGPGGNERRSRLEWWWWLVAGGALPLLLIEWWIYTRRLKA